MKKNPYRFDQIKRDVHRWDEKDTTIPIKQDDAKWLIEQLEADDVLIGVLMDESLRFRTALIELSKCSGGCEGPMGCMCKAPIARKALEKK